MAVETQFSSKQKIGFVIALVAGVSVYPIARALGLEKLLNWIVGLLLLAVLGYLIWFLSKNQKMAVATPEQTQAALRFQPISDRGVIYLYRSQLGGMFAGLPITHNGTSLGQTRGFCFFRLEVEPGAHVFAGDHRCSTPLSITVALGQVAYVKQTFGAKNNQAVYDYTLTDDAAMAQEKIRKLKMFLPSRSEVAA